MADQFRRKSITGRRGYNRNLPGQKTIRKRRRAEERNCRSPSWKSQGHAKDEDQ
ncbi:unnamed protein product, partial [Nesidiocoris tenuis]